MKTNDAHATVEIIAFIWDEVVIEVFAEAELDVDRVVDTILVAIDEEARGSVEGGDVRRVDDAVAVEVAGATAAFWIGRAEACLDILEVDTEIIFITVAVEIEVEVRAAE